MGSPTRLVSLSLWNHRTSHTEEDASLICHWIIGFSFILPFDTFYSMLIIIECFYVLSYWKELLCIEIPSKLHFSHGMFIWHVTLFWFDCNKLHFVKYIAICGAALLGTNSVANSAPRQRRLSDKWLLLKSPNFVHSMCYVHTIFI